MPLDRIDKKILKALQSDGRMPNADLAEQNGVLEPHQAADGGRLHPVDPGDSRSRKNRLAGARHGRGGAGPLHPGVRQLRTFFALNEVKSSQDLPLD